MKIAALTLTLVAFLALAAPAECQRPHGSIRGHVTSSDGTALAGVEVTCRHLPTGNSRSVLANRDGLFRVPALPPGELAVTVALPGFKTCTSSVNLNAAVTTVLEISMVPEADADPACSGFAQSATSPRPTTSGRTIDVAALYEQIPMTRDSQRLSLLTPATTPGDSGFDGHELGTFGQRLNSIGGASVAENAYLVNGLDITNFRTGIGCSWVPLEALEQVEILDGGFGVEFGRSSGGVVNLVMRSGGNRLHGSASAWFEPRSMQSQEPDTFRAPNQVEDRERLELNAAVAGPLVRDTLFFSAFLSYLDTDEQVADFTHTVERFSGSEPYYGVKFDWIPSANHSLEAFYLSDDTSIDTSLFQLDDTDIDSPPIGHGTVHRGGANALIKYMGVLDPDLVLGAQIGTHRFERTDSSPGDAYPYAWDTTSGSISPIGYWSNGFRHDADDERQVFSFDLDWRIGDHELGAGVDAQRNTSWDRTEYSGGYRVTYLLNDFSFPDLEPDQMVADHRIYRSAGDYDLHQDAVYVRDRWMLDRNLTLDIGLRWERFEHFNPSGGTFLKIDDFAPRIGATWDPTGKGRARLYSSFGTYHLPIPSNINIRTSGGEYYVRSYYSVDGFNPDGSPINLGAEPLLEPTVYADGRPADPRSIAAEDLDAMSQREFTLGYEQAFGDFWTFGVRGVARQFEDVLEDINLERHMLAVHGIDIGRWWGVVANPGSGVTAWLDTDFDGNPERYAFTAEELGYPEPERKYYALELSARRGFTNRWMFDASYTWAHSYGNYEGPADSTCCSAGGVTQLFDDPGFMDYSWGNLPNDRRHNVKVFGSYAFDWGLQLGAHATYRSGRPINGLGIHPTDQWAWYYGASSFYVGGEPSPRASYGTTDNLWSLDTMVRYGIQVADLEFDIRVDVFNLFNNDSVTEVDEHGDTDYGYANPDFLEATAHQAPRSVRLGVAMSF